MLSLKADKHPWVVNPVVGDKVRILDITFSGRHEAVTISELDVLSGIKGEIGTVKEAVPGGIQVEYDLRVVLDKDPEGHLGSWVFYFDQVELL